MRAIVTGQVGIDKKSFLTAVERLAGQRGQSLGVYHVGDRMYAEAHDVRPGRILDLPLSRLSTLRRAVFRDIVAEARDKPNIIVNTHATFRWRHGLFSAFDFDQLRQLQPDMLICLVDNIEVVHHRLHMEHTIDATLKDLMVGREEEIVAGVERLVAGALADVALLVDLVAVEVVREEIVAVDVGEVVAEIDHRADMRMAAVDGGRAGFAGAAFARVHDVTGAVG